jgi:hypothetical protein
MICHQCAILLCEQCSSFHRRSRRTKHHVLSSGKGNSPGFHTARGVQTEGPSPEAIEASWRHKTESLEEAKLQAEQRVHDITCTLEKEHKNVLSLQQQLTLQKNQSAEEIDAAKAVSKAAHARIAELKSSLELEHECVLSLQEHLTALKDAHRTEVCSFTVALSLSLSLSLSPCVCVFMCVCVCVCARLLLLSPFPPPGDDWNTPGVYTLSHCERCCDSNIQTTRGA